VAVHISMLHDLKSVLLEVISARVSYIPLVCIPFLLLSIVDATTNPLFSLKTWFALQFTQC